MKAASVDIPRIKFNLALVPIADEIEERLVVRVIGLSAIIALFPEVPFEIF